MSGTPLPPDRTGVWHRRMPADATSHGPASTEPGMTVFWDEDRPIGHILVMPDGSKTRVEPRHANPLPVPQGGGTLTASVVICTRDRPDDIVRCLASLPLQTRHADEIIVVDNASRDDRTRQAVITAGATYVREDRPGLDYARNTGVTTATGDLILFTDDDVLLDPSWIERMVAAFDAPDIGAVTGLVLPAELAAESQFMFERFWSFNHGYARRDVTKAEFERYQGRELFPVWDLGAGASMAFRRSVFADLGLFDERLGAGRSGCSDDSEYWYRLLHHGWTCRYEPSIVGYHYHRADIAGLSHQIRQYMRGHVAALFIQHQRTGRRGNLWRAMWYLPRDYARRSIRNWILRRNRAQDRFLREEIGGFLAGFLFYARNTREN